VTTVTIHEAKTNLSKLIAAALAGEEIVIARGKEPVVTLTPVVKKQGKRTPGLLKGVISDPDESAFAPMTDEELAEWGLL
jgi:antitoxin (DNA-binding transcriptional repressor) of toxin-antitoxin stability system